MSTTHQAPNQNEQNPMKSRYPILHLFSIIIAAICASFLALANVACASSPPPSADGTVVTAPAAKRLSLDLIAGVCVHTERGDVCYNPLSKQWTVKLAGTAKSQPLTVVRQDTGTVTLSTSDGGTLIYRDGRIEWPTEPDRSDK